MAIQNKEKTFQENENVYKVKNFTTDKAIEEGIKTYVAKEPDRVYLDTDLMDCRDWWTRYITEYRHWSALDREVVSAEGYFDYQFDDDWAKYEFNVKGKTITGNLAIKGTMDLLFKVDDDTYEYVDIKTGKRRNFNTGETKNHETLKKDMQLLLYYYALKRRYPDKNINITMMYISHGGAFPVMMDEKSIVLLKEKLKGHFEKVKSINKPNNIKGDFKCNYCPFKSNIYKNGVTYCNWFDMELQKVGVELVTDKYVKGDGVGQYFSGGGRDHQKKEK